MMENAKHFPDFCPLTESQLGVYLDAKNEQNSVKYNISQRFMLPEGTDRERYIAAFIRAASLHPTFCVTVGEKDGEPGMFYRPAPISVSVETEKTPLEVSEELRRPYDLSAGPLCRFVYVEKEGMAPVMCLDAHHIIFDGSSLHLMLEQSLAAYDGKELVPETVTQFDVAAEERKPRDPARLAEYRAFFDRMLGGADCDSKPVCDEVRKNVPKEVHRLFFSWESFDADTVKAFCAAEKISENAFFLSVFAYTLAKLNGTSDAFFTAAHNGRQEKARRNSVGMFVKTLPLAVSVDENEAPAALARRVYDDYFTLRNNDCIPFSELCSAYGVGLDVTFMYQQGIYSGCEFSAGRAYLEQADNDNSVSALEIMLFPNAEGHFDFSVFFRTDEYTEAFIRDLASLYETVVRGFLKEKRLGDIALVGDAVRERLDGFNATETPYPADKTVVDLFREQAAETPDALCLVCREKRYSYREVDRITDRLAKHLVREGLSRGKVAGILIPRCEYMLLGALGVLKSGAAYMPLDPTYPAERLNLMMRDSGAVFLLTTPELSPMISEEFTGKRMYTEEIPGLADSDTELPVPQPEDLFIMLYTSGSTGTPKGVMFAHSNTMVTAAWERRFFALGPGCANTANASFGFDANVFDMYCTVTSGAALHVITDDIRLDLPALRDYYNENHITHSTMTTQVGRAFATLGGLCTLRHLSVAGEKLTPFVPEGDFSVYNLYGPTEGSVLVSGFRLDGDYRDVPIGRAVDNVKLYVVDKEGRMLPPGCTGELWASGPHVTVGYLNRPEKTAEAYGRNPFTRQPLYERVYRTGDIVRMMSDGNLQFIGRRDGQVKVRGFRVELTEIEEIFRRFPGVKDATVAAFDDLAGGKFVAAYYVADADLDEKKIGDFIRAEKPPYMVPAVFVRLDKIPLNQNQKVNKKALPIPERRAEKAVLPETETQKKIFDIVAEVLGHTGFGVDTSLYDAGLSSIAALKLNVALGKAFDVPVRLDDVKENGTVRKLEGFLTAARTEETREILPDYPISKTQEGIFIECSQHPGTVRYNVPLLLQLDSSVDTERFAAALTAAMNAHPYFRTELFAAEDGSIRARRRDGTPPVIDVISCDRLPSPEELVRPFVLLNAPLYRLSVYKTGSGLYFFADFHHIVADGTSVNILLSDVDTAYRGGTPEPETYTGFDVAADEERLRASPKFGEARAYFDRLCGGAETECLPPKSGSGDAVPSAYSFTVEGAGEAEAFCREKGITLNAFFNAAFGFTLSKFVQPDDVVFTTVYHGRSDSRLGRTGCMLVKTLPVLVRTEGTERVSDLLAATQKQLTDTMSHDVYSFAEIAAAYGIRSDILFVYQGDLFRFDTLCGAPAVNRKVQPTVAKAPLSVCVYKNGDRFEVETEYLSDCFGKGFLDAFSDAFAAVLERFRRVEKLRDVSILSAGAKAKLDRFNDTVRPYVNQPAHRFIEQIVPQKPDAVAVCDKDSTLTWQELNRRANRIAHALIARGVRADSVVGVMLDRTVNITLCELAVWKAGGAFLGLLPSYPDDRIDFCLSDADSTLVITSDDILAARPQLFAEEKPYRAVTVAALEQCTDESNPEPEISTESLAYCIYTSGSTGKPKGVMVTHRNLANLQNPHDFPYRYYHGSESGNCALALSSVSFDMSVFDNLLILMAGKSVCMASEYEIHNPAALAALFAARGVDTMGCTPSFLTNCVGMPAFRPAIAQLRCVVSGAEAFPGTLYTALRNINPDLRILNGYGPSECTITCCSKEITDPKHITIGGPAANTQFYVVDKSGNILPPYGCGELIICGDLVGRGYIKLPEKTAAAFFTLEGHRAYHSGDTVRLNDDGEVEFFGRIDNQVKLRGFRVELDEIEKTVCAYPGVTQSKVIVRNNGTEDYLCAFFTASEKIELTDLTSFLKGKLTYYMVPDAMAQLEAMPLTPNGKIDKKALPEIRREARKKAKKAPKKSMEQELCDLFGSVLGQEEFYADDNFFEMGGTSLSASKVTMQLMSRGIKVEYQDIFDNPTPEGLAAFIADKTLPAEAGPAEKTQNGLASPYDDILAHNALEYAAEVQREPLGNVLLTGAVGFLGVHVLRELMERGEGKILCLVRKGDFQSSDARLKSILMYYFGELFPEKYAEYVTLIDADLTDDSLADILRPYAFDTVINCAACVKHYAANDVIERINVHGVENLIAVAKARSCRLIQISTTSVPGVHTEDTYRRRVTMHENELFVIDDMQNKYCISKYRAEQRVLEAVRGGLRGKIIRVGNLMGRQSDGEFQINYNTNAFLNALRGFATIGKCPISHATDPMRFSPIDMTARVIVLLSGTNDCFTAFHADNRFGFDEWQLVEAANRSGISIRPVPDGEYYDDYYRMLGDEKLNARLQGLMTNDRPDLHAVDTDNNFTANILYRLGFSWPITDIDYLERALGSLLTLDYFAPDDTSEEPNTTTNIDEKGDSAMNLTKTEENGKVVLAPDGWLDTLSSPSFTEAVEGVKEAKVLVLDFEKVEYLSSAGLRAVVAASRKARELGAAFAVVNVCPEVYSIFRMTGIDKKLNVSEK